MHAMLHDLLITVHAVAATAAWVAGLVALPGGRLLAVHRGTLVVMAGALAAAVVVGWPGYPTASRVIFPVLLVLAAAMLVRTELAARVRPATVGATTPRYVDHLGFSLISLSVGFLLIAVLRAGAPGWVAVAVGVGTVVGGRAAVGAATRRWAAEPARA